MCLACVAGALEVTGARRNGAREVSTRWGVWCQIVPLWMPLEHFNFSLRLQPHSPIELENSKVWPLSIPFSGVNKTFTAFYCATCLQTIPSFLSLTVFSPNANTNPLGNPQPTGIFRTLRKRVKKIFMGLSGRRSLSPRVSPPRAPFFLAPISSKRLLRRLLCTTLVRTYQEFFVIT